MAGNMSRAHLDDKRQQRLAWLRDHPAVWQGLPSDTEDVEPEASERIADLVTQFRLLGLFGKGAFPEQKMSVRRAIGELKREVHA
jgi:hypothetical protein